jgi:dTDP-4-dehydrorhamnose 3,5-epimerase
MFESIGIEMSIAQINFVTIPLKGTLKGLHMQMSNEKEYKAIRCLKGEIWDVIVDFRKKSPTFMSWQHINLSNSNQILIIPPGCAHGFQTLTNNVEMLYLHTANYQPDAEINFLPLDTQLKIKWPLEITEISNKDKNAPLVPMDFKGI